MPARRSPSSSKSVSVKISEDAHVILRKIAGLTGEFIEEILSDLVRVHGDARLKQLLIEENRQYAKKPTPKDERN